jgi:hypothetical protein
METSAESLLSQSSEIIASLPPQPFKTRRIGRRVAHRILNVPVTEIVLNEPRVRALISEGIAASMSQQVRVGNDL